MLKRLSLLRCCVLYVVGQGNNQIPLADGDYVIAPYPHNIVIERKEMAEGKGGFRTLLLATVGVLSNRPSGDLERICEFQVRGDILSGDRLTKGASIRLSAEQKTAGCVATFIYTNASKKPDRENGEEEDRGDGKILVEFGYKEK